VAHCPSCSLAAASLMDAVSRNLQQATSISRGGLHLTQGVRRHEASGSAGDPLE
jgi:hypothetical protein